MSKRITILIVEDEMMIALDLVDAVEARGGTVIGPFDTVAEALSLTKDQAFDAAVLDANLRDRDVTPLALALIERDVPFVVHSGIGLPDELAATYPELPMLLKPMAADRVVDTLWKDIPLAS